jgi:3-oxoacyl-[acyl-carrier-protein] synthase II
VEHAAGKVAVTGLGAVTPFGVGVEALWEGVCSGRSTAGVVEEYAELDLPVGIACRAQEFSPGDHLPRKLLRQLDRSSQFGLVAVGEALADAGLAGEGGRIDGAEPGRTGVVMGSGIGSVLALLDEQVRLEEHGAGRVRPYLAVALPPNMTAGQAAIRHGFQGPSCVIATACASGGDAIGYGRDLIASGKADVVVAGGAEAPIAPVVLATFAAAGALSRAEEPSTASRPFDRGRDGFVLGEGAGAVVLERAEHARARGARVHAWLAGHAATTDAHHATQPAPGGSGAARAISIALATAGLDPADVDHVNAHGTSTQANDAAEAAALHTALGAAAGDVAVTSTKSMIGHLFGAAGAVEAVATVLALREGMIPPTATTRDVDVDLDVVLDTPRKLDCEVALSNSLGFGGHNSVLVLMRS